MCRAKLIATGGRIHVGIENVAGVRRVTEHSSGVLGCEDARLFRAFDRS